MKYRNHAFQSLKIPPENILEIRLSLQTWDRVIATARAKRRSYSWIVRYCVFRAIDRKRPLRLCAYHEAACRQKRSPGFHRHRLCLYGEDEFLIRVTAGRIGCTMTHLVRMALEWNLPRLSIAGKGGVAHQMGLYWLGIKRKKDGEFPILFTDRTSLLFTPFPQTSYW